MGLILGFGQPGGDSLQEGVAAVQEVQPNGILETSLRALRQRLRYKHEREKHGGGGGSGETRSTEAE